VIVHRHRERYKNGWLVAEDWPTQELAVEAVELALKILPAGSGYAGSRSLDAVADFIVPLLGIDRSRPFGMSLLVEGDRP